MLCSSSFFGSRPAAEQDSHEKPEEVSRLADPACQIACCIEIHELYGSR